MREREFETRNRTFIIRDGQWSLHEIEVSTGPLPNPIRETILPEGLHAAILLIPYDVLHDKRPYRFFPPEATYF